MQLRRRLALPATAFAVVALAVLSIVAVVYGVVFLSFGDTGQRLWAALLVMAAIAGFVLAMWLGTGRPPGWGGGDRGHRVHDERRRTEGVGRSPYGLRIPPVGPLGRKHERRPRRR